MKKIMILAGGNDQAALIQEIRKKFDDVQIILIDFAKNVVASKYADKHIVESTMDLPKVKEIAQEEKVDYIMTACGDQPLLTMATVSSELGLPCYIGKEQVLTLTNKMYMKDLMMKNDIPTSLYKTFKSSELITTDGLSYPLVVKPVDSNGSKGVRKVTSEDELKDFAKQAFKFSLSDTIIVEEFNEGVEISSDYYIVGDTVTNLMNSQLNKWSPDSNTAVIYQSVIPPAISNTAKRKLDEIAKKIAKGYGVTNSPLLMQTIVNGDSVKVLEFSARIGGGAKYQTIEKVTGFNVLKANLESMLGERPDVSFVPSKKYYSRCHIYLIGGTFETIEGLESLKEEGIIEEFIITKPFGVLVNPPKSSSDRVASILLVADSRDELDNKIKYAIKTIKVLNNRGEDILSREMYL